MRIRSVPVSSQRPRHRRQAGGQGRQLQRPTTVLRKVHEATPPPAPHLKVLRPPLQLGHRGFQVGRGALEAAPAAQHSPAKRVLQCCIQEPNVLACPAQQTPHAPLGAGRWARSVHQKPRLLSIVWLACSTAAACVEAYSPSNRAERHGTNGMTQTGNIDRTWCPPAAAPAPPPPSSLTAGLTAPAPAPLQQAINAQLAVESRGGNCVVFASRLRSHMARSSGCSGLQYPASIVETAPSRRHCLLPPRAPVAVPGRHHTSPGCPGLPSGTRRPPTCLGPKRLPLPCDTVQERRAHAAKASQQQLRQRGVLPQRLPVLLGRCGRRERACV